MPAVIEHFTSGGRAVIAEVFEPISAGRHPATLVLHGTFGLLPQYRSDIVSFAEALAANGIVAVLPHYFDRTGTAAGPDAGVAIPTHLQDWKEACGDALGFMCAQPGVDASRLSLIGFSLGGHIALDLAMSPHAGSTIKCAVDFFGPTSSPRLLGNRAALPPVLIHHGTADPLVPISDSISLVAELRAAGKVEGVGYTFVQYPGAGHGFTGTDLTASRSATVAFVAEVV